MTLATALEERLTDRAGPVDYDASEHVATAAAAVLRLTPRSPGQRQALFLLTHWGYGSSAAVGYEALRPWIADDVPRTAVFFGGCQLMAFTLFPTVGGTPPPWRWSPALLASGLAQHAIYAVSVALVSERLGGRGRKNDTRCW